MITANTTITPSAGNFVDVTNRPSAGEIVVLRNASSVLYLERYSSSTGAAVTSGSFALTGTMGTSACIAMLDNNKCAVIDSSGNVQVYDLTTQTRLWVATVTANTVSPQSLSGNTTNTIAMGCISGGSAGALNVINQATTSASTIGGSSPNQHWACVIAKPGTSNFIVGSTDENAKSAGYIAEIDANCNTVQCYTLPPPLDHTPQNNTLRTRTVQQIAYYSGYLLALTTWCELFLYDHESGKLLQSLAFPQSSNNSPPLWMSEAVNGEVFLLESNDATTGNNMRRIIEIDFVRTPMLQVSMQYVSGTGVAFPNIIKPGCQSGCAWAATQGSIVLYHWTYSRSLTTHSVSYVDGSSNPVAGECYVVDDTVSPAQLMFSTTIPTSGKSVPVTTGKTGNGLLLIHSFGKGVRQQFCAQRITT